ncbi:hypothetical protein XAV_07660 [Xanthomonas axonopodis pv. vasculorum]|uniref:hypothetical protein n=1 Tax=Xanthomonas axonopodis TaxID=53413 RepID=UPI00149593F3|nr:hypothetical protein [Xanthomonas axonopodis]QKD86306.1 hypothetical protein XAV_07660 [Xanthomonas axonopodis pv. vasculorum]
MSKPFDVVLTMTTVCKSVGCHDCNRDQTAPINADPISPSTPQMRLSCGDVS